MPEPHYKALLIGNGTFDRDPHKLFALKGPANDLRVLREALTHPEFGLFDPNNVRHLLDGTHGEVLEAVEMFFSDAGPEDHLLFYYSGHGYPDTNNNLYLCARNTRTNLLGSSAIPDKTINLMAENSRARKFIFVLDCCHSGGFKGGTAGVQLAHGSGRCLITACASDQLSSDSQDKSGASTFTHFLAEALTSGSVDTDGDGVVLTSEVFKYVQPRVYNATKQTVQWSMDKTFGEAAIARALPRSAAPATPAPPTVRVQPEAGRPILEVSWDKPIEFRQVQVGEKLPVERIDVFNGGDGILNWAFECEEPWINIERKDDTLFVKLDTTQPGLRRGNIYVRDRGRGGSRTIRVLLEIIEPVVPRMLVSPSALDFGECEPNSGAKLELRVTNGGAGRLNWDVESAPNSVIVSRHEHGLTVELARGVSGEVKAAIRLKSNGGNAKVMVTATVKAAEPPVLAPVAPRIDPLLQKLPGWWMNDTGAIRIRLENGALQYTDHNLMAIKVGQGTVHVQNGVAILQGSNTFSGAYTGQFTLQNETLVGSLAFMGQTIPVMFARQDPWFAAFTS